MLLAPFAVVVLLVFGDWVVWNWAIGADHGTIALISGMAMAPLVVALAWYGARALSAMLGAALRRAESELRARTQGPALRPRTTHQRDEAAAAAERAPDRLVA
jgi:integral membrane sensor domain MASE1